MTNESAKEPVEKKASIDLAKFDKLAENQEKGADVAILGPDGKTPLGFSIRVAGPDSEKQRKAVETLQNEQLAREDLTELTAEDIGLRRVRGLAMSIISWDEFQLDGQPYKLTVENATKLFQRFPFIREQVEAKAGKRAAFLKE